MKTNTESNTERRAVPKEKKNYSEKIRAEIEKSSLELSRARSLVQNDADQGEDPTREGRQTTAAKYTEQWKIMQ